MLQPDQLDLMPDLEPALDPSLGQYFTPPLLAERIAVEFPIRGRVLEPTAGNGNLVDAIGGAHFDHAHVTAVEIDPRWAAVLRRRFARVPEDVSVIEGDVIAMPLGAFDWVVANPPDASKAGLDVVDFLARFAELAPECVCVQRTNALHCGARWERVWSHVHVRRISYLVQRPRFVAGGGEQEWSVVHFGREPSAEPVRVEWWEGSWS